MCHSKLVNYLLKLIFQLLTFSAPSNGSYRIIGGKDAKPSEGFFQKHKLRFHLDLGPVPP